MRTSHWLPGFLTLSAIWGSSFALIKIAVDAGVAPMWVALWRCLFGALALFAICWARRLPLPRDRATWGHALVVAALLNAVPFVLLAHGETQVSSLLAGVLNATTPLNTLIFALLLVPGERPTGRRLLGLLVGFAGVLVVLGVWNGFDGGSVTGSVFCLLATACYGAGFAYTRRFFSGRAGSAASLSAAQIGCATLELTLVAPFAAGPPVWPGLPAAAGLLALGVIGTGVAYILNLRVIQVAGPTVAAAVTYVTPLWSTLIGALLLAEPLGPHTVAGGLLVIGGVLLINRSAAGRGPTWGQSETATGRTWATR
ncbi:transporter [Microtetraspora sp. NBRC 13810]|uniref:DMT family transporter n=1 Tax=Microtetraspora sp. NBRC 13810 TaxID=3030990 RepID=UPI0024A1E78C|nr:DMT family transporter [Microtetraspora sp. NBRC 13810]GLW10004.1 transporter [Microtetraspora sp. NBRC 13810]